MSITKICSLPQLCDTVKVLQAEGHVVVQSHGVFDLIHPGIITHLNRAREQGDVLVVTVIKDKDVRRGPNRPVFPEEHRVQSVASLEQVDYVCLVDDEIPFESVKKLNPDIFARGQSLKERVQHIHDKIFEEEKELYLGKCRIYETGGLSLSSTKIINNFLDIYPEETRQFLRDFARRYPFESISRMLDTLWNLRVLVIGDGIIDEYHYCHPMGRASKAPLVVHNYLYHEAYAGGVFAVANHLASLCDQVHLVSVLGREDSREEFILQNLKPPVNTAFFYRDDGPTVMKKRYINQYYNQKLFEVNYLTNTFLEAERERDVLEYLEGVLADYELVLVADFGHGFLTARVIDLIEQRSRKVAVNSQNNAANTGYNMITRYRTPRYVCLDEAELRLAAQERFAPIESLLTRFSSALHTDYFMVTLGKRGSVGIDAQGHIHHTPIFSSKVLDTVGAGDAFFAFTAPCVAREFPPDLIGFLGNAVGALAVQIMCNKKAVEKYELLEFIHALLQ